MKAGEPKSVRVNGAVVSYREGGAGHEKTLILLHGGIGSPEIQWRASLPALAASYHVIAPDLPGFGESDRLPAPNFPNYSAWLRGFLDALNISRMTLLGNSFGGTLARCFAAAYPEQVSGLILVNGGALPSPVTPLMRTLLSLPVVDHLLLRYAAGTVIAPKSLAESIYVKSTLTDEFRQSTTKTIPGLTDMLAAMMSEALPTAATPSSPTLLLWGANDALTPLAVAEAIRAEIPGSALVKIAECGHVPQMEAAEVFAFQVDQYIARGMTPTLSQSDKLRGVGRLGTGETSQ